MIFVLLGTQDASFTRLTNMVRELVQTPNWQEEVIIQSGTTPIEWGNEHVQVSPFFEKSVFQTHFKNARIIITHGGAGTMFEALNENKKTIVIPRLAQFGEHVDDHQLELATMFSDLGYLEIHQYGHLVDTINKVEITLYNKYEANHKLAEHIQRRYR